MTALRKCAPDGHVHFREAWYKKSTPDYRTPLNKRFKNESVLERDIRVAREINQPVLDVLHVPTFKIRPSFTEILDIQTCLKFIFELEIAAKEIHRKEANTSKVRLYDRIAHELQIHRREIERMFVEVDEQTLLTAKKILLRFGIRSAARECIDARFKTQVIQLSFF
ncbi:MAG: hypothetical protein JJ954_08865 [Hyphomonas sp.]|uniref:hypothetical protein n=1 Tax=Hyphomonas sp. TaxID=87 RepID=UPI001B22090E|nr:hypothetical protein [Hyphomonas sp.]MBO6583053.1 hypothetical protein [Hyphomonas sp.]